MRAQCPRGVRAQMVGEAVQAAAGPRIRRARWPAGPGDQRPTPGTEVDASALTSGAIGLRGEGCRLWARAEQRSRVVQVQPLCVGWTGSSPVRMRSPVHRQSWPDQWSHTAVSQNRVEVSVGD
ncbi:hypothetical protein GUJ93_ZPchr0013g34623 [Zizania palustris]|uniref:Uncharacterized protein n=1 Tax=Zizania palustris TaxID=103762 RepID=A0A8J5WVX8_ZIZPA|nr:hypothetical protein GUJ93_ZPchr0013g34623 [Zizania palustris]